MSETRSFDKNNEGWHNLKGGCRVRLTEDGCFEIGAQPGYEKPMLPNMSEGENIKSHLTPGLYHRTLWQVSGDDYTFENLAPYKVKSIVVVDNVYANPNSSLLFMYFDNCEFMDLTKLDTSMVRNMHSMFGINTSKEIKGLETWDTSSVTRMDRMFDGCFYLKTPPNVGDWDISNVRNMEGMFCSCLSLVNPPDVKNWDTGKVESMKEMFSYCCGLKVPPDVKNWNTSRVDDASEMFAFCSNLEIPPEVDNWKLYNSVDVGGMFFCCDSLKDAPDMLALRTRSIEKARRDYGEMAEDLFGMFDDVSNDADREYNE